MHLAFLLFFFVQPPSSETKPPPLLQSITVTATRSELPTEQVPVSLSTATAADISTRRLQLLDQALNTMPGLFAFRGKGPQDTNAGVGMRGFAGRGSSQSRVLVLLDGQPINDSYTGQVPWTSLPIEEVDRVEVVRGSFSSLYGGNAMGGVINILTKPVAARQAEIYGQLGNQSSARYGGRLAHRFRERLGASLAYDRLQSGGYPSQYVASAGTAASGGTLVTGAVPTLTSAGAQTFLLGRSGNNWWNQHALRARADYTFSPATLLYVQFQHQRSAYGYDQSESFLRTAAGLPFDNGTASFVFNGAPRRFSLTPATFLNGNGQTNFWLLSSRLHHQISPSTQLQLALGHSRSPLNYYSTPGANSTGVISDRPYRSWFVNAQLASRLSSRHHITTGADTRQDSSSLAETSVPNWTRPTESPTLASSSQGAAFNQGAYLQHQFRAAERLTLTSGARYDYWRTYDGGYTSTVLPARANHSASLKAAALYRLPLSLALRASAGNSFRAPSVYDLYRTWRASSGVTFAANPNLRPERLTAFELGLARRWSHRLELDAAFFHNRVSNLIYRSTDFATDPAGNYRPVINAGRARTRGFEASARLPLASWLHSSSSYTWNDARITENTALPATVGKRVPFVPAHAAASTLTATIRRLTASATGRYTAPLFSTDFNTDTTRGVYGAYDPFFSLDAGLGFPLHRRLSLGLSGENLLDRRFFSFYPSPGRLFSARLRIRL